MGKLIDSDWLKAQWNEPTNWMDGDQVLHHYIWFKMVLELAPTVDAVPVRHGRWNCSDDVYENAVCSVCGWDTAEPWEYIKDRFEFCPHCGADMRGDGDD